MKITINIKKTLSFLFIIMLFLASDSSPEVSSKKQVIAVIRSRPLEPYNNALSGFKEGLKQDGYKITYNYYDLEAVKGEEWELLSEIKDLGPDLVFTLGTEGALFAKKNIKDLPIIFSMVLDPVESGIVKSLSGSGDNITGVSLNIPVKMQFRKLKQMVPKLTRIGIIYDARKKVKLKEEAIIAAKKLGLRVVAKPIYSQADIASALYEVIKEADCLWAGVDTLVYSPQSAKHILLTTIRNRLPFMAFSSHYVRAGALMAMECDYHDIGTQSAQVAIKVLNGKKAGSIPISLPRNTRLVINKRTAEVIGITITKKLLDEAEKVFGIQ